MSAAPVTVEQHVAWVQKAAARLLAEHERARAVHLPEPPRDEIAQRRLSQAVRAATEKIDRAWLQATCQLASLETLRPSERWRACEELHPSGLLVAVLLGRAGQLDPSLEPESSSRCLHWATLAARLARRRADASGDRSAREAAVIGLVLLVERRLQLDPSTSVQEEMAELADRLAALEAPREPALAVQLALLWALHALSVGDRAAALSLVELARPVAERLCLAEERVAVERRAAEVHEAQGELPAAFACLRRALDGDDRPSDLLRHHLLGELARLEGAAGRAAAEKPPRFGMWHAGALSWTERREALS